MSATWKHWLDIFTGIATVLSTVATPIITTVTGVLGCIWYCIRIYQWYKGKYNGNE